MCAKEHTAQNDWDRYTESNGEWKKWIERAKATEKNESENTQNLQAKHINFVVWMNAFAWCELLDRDFCNRILVNCFFSLVLGFKSYLGDFF